MVFTKDEGPLNIPPKSACNVLKYTKDVYSCCEISSSIL